MDSSSLPLDQLSHSTELPIANQGVACDHRCQVQLLDEDEGDFSAVVLNLPRTGSCGDTAEEAIENVKEAIAGAIESYRKSGKPVPWRTEVVSHPADARIVWITVRA